MNKVYNKLMRKGLFFTSFLFFFFNLQNASSAVYYISSSDGDANASDCTLTVSVDGTFLLDSSIRIAGELVTNDAGFNAGNGTVCSFKSTTGSVSYGRISNFFDTTASLSSLGMNSLGAHDAGSNLTVSYYNITTLTTSVDSVSASLPFTVTASAPTVNIFFSLFDMLNMYLSERKDSENIENNQLSLY